MNLRFLEAFHWAVSLQSVTRAAERLHLTQSALSARIAALEQELGVVLLDRRDKQQFRLTQAGQRFHGLAQQMLRLQRQVKEEMGRHGDGADKDTGPRRPVHLRIGAIESVLHSWLSDWLLSVRETLPEFELALTVETSLELVEQLRRGQLDLVFASLPAADTAALRSRPLPSMSMACLGPQSLPPLRGRRRRYGLRDLAGQELLTFQRGSQPHQALLQLFQDAALEPPRIHTISSIAAMLQLVQAGFGIATLPLAVAQRVVRQQMPAVALQILPCNFELAPLLMHASYRPDPASDLIEELLASAQPFAEQG
ncbi:LysR family transcriptional regulator [Paucibacter sp. AS339]|uniref:LysR family transcriptional regulator n=1 Tax=Paucibacter hankyongi TaxID=3133434 RepID=UPI0030AC6E9D